MKEENPCLFGKLDANTPCLANRELVKIDILKIRIEY